MAWLEDQFSETETALIGELKSAAKAIKHRSGKGDEGEAIVEKRLLQPYLRPDFRIAKGSVVSFEEPGNKSPEIDRIVFNPNDAPPLSHGLARSVLPIESVCGLVQITLSLDRSKLRTDIENMSPIKAMRNRRYLTSLGATVTKIMPVVEEWMSPRAFVIGMPSDNWKTDTIALALHEIQANLGPPTLVHGLYVIGSGYFETIPAEPPMPQHYSIRAWTGPDRLFRFATGFWTAFHRWLGARSGHTADLSAYSHREPDILLDRSEKD